MSSGRKKMGTYVKINIKHIYEMYVWSDYRRKIQTKIINVKTHAKMNC